MKLLSLILSLCTANMAGAQTTKEDLVKEFRSKISVVEKAEVLRKWAYQHGDEGTGELIVKTASGTGVSDTERIKVTETLLLYFKWGREFLEKEGRFQAAQAEDHVSRSDFETVKRLVEVPGYVETTEKYVSAIKAVPYLAYIKMEPKNWPERVVSVSLGGAYQGMTVRLFFFFRITEQPDKSMDWGLEMIIPVIESNQDDSIPGAARDFL